MMNFLIEFLYYPPEPTQNVKTRHKNAMIIVHILLAPYILALIYVVFIARDRDIPQWWQTIIDWVFATIPAAQGHTYRAVNTADIWPEVYTIFFLYGMLVFVILIVSSPGLRLTTVDDNGPTWKRTIYLIFWIFFINTLLLWICVFWGETEPRQHRNWSPTAHLTENKFSIVFLTSLFFYVAGIFCGETAATIKRFIREFTRRAIS